MPRHDGNLRLNDWFCGAGGSTQGAATIPGVQPVHAANHWAKAIESHAANFPDVDHWKGDIRDLDVAKLPYAELFWASPECTNWSRARGKTRDYAVSDTALPGLEEPAPSEEVERSRALMEEVPLYLEAMVRRGKPVLAGVVENVTDIRDWTDWARWRAQIEGLGYRTRLIALNSMHAQSVRALRAPQSRDRLYLAYWHRSLGRDPDWDKWLRPYAWCPTCEERVSAVQVFKDPNRDMGRYRQQYVYRCPRATCRGQVVEPEFAPAYTAIDWTIRGERIGDRTKPLAAKTLARIEAGLRKFARPITVEASGHTFERRPGVRTWPADGPLTTLTTSLTRGVAVAPMLVPAGGTWNDTAVTVLDPMRARTARENEAVVVPPMVVPIRTHGTSAPLDQPFKTFVAGNQGMAVLAPPFVVRHYTPRGQLAQMSTSIEAPSPTLTASTVPTLVVPTGMVMRNNGSRGDGGEHCTGLDDSLRTLTTTGHQSLVTWGWDEWAAVYQYRKGREFTDLTEPLATQTTIQGDALIAGTGVPDVEDCLFRMLEPHEIGAGMAFADGYVVLGNRRERVRQYGNAVTPPASEVIVSALVEAITGEPLERAA